MFSVDCHKQIISLSCPNQVKAKTFLVLLRLANWTKTALLLVDRDEIIGVFQSVINDKEIKPKMVDVSVATEYPDESIDESEDDDEESDDGGDLVEDLIRDFEVGRLYCLVLFFFFFIIF